MDHKNNSEKEATSRKKVFFPKARVLSGEEVNTLSANEKAFAKECQDRGVWLEIISEYPQNRLFTKLSNLAADLSILYPDQALDTV